MGYRDPPQELIDLISAISHAIKMIRILGSERFLRWSWRGRRCNGGRCCGRGSRRGSCVGVNVGAIVGVEVKTAASVSMGSYGNRRSCRHRRPCSGPVPAFVLQESLFQRTQEHLHPAFATAAKSRSLSATGSIRPVSPVPIRSCPFCLFWTSFPFESRLRPQTTPLAGYLA